MVMLLTERQTTPLGSALRTLRKRAGLTQLQLSDATGVERSYISMLETGERDSPSHTIMVSLAQGVGVPLREFYVAAAMAWPEGTPTDEATVIRVADKDKASVLRRLTGWSHEQLVALERMGRIAFSTPAAPHDEAEQQRPGDAGKDEPEADPEGPAVG